MGVVQSVPAIENDTAGTPAAPISPTTPVLCTGKGKVFDELHALCERRSNRLQKTLETLGTSDLQAFACRHAIVVPTDVASECLFICRSLVARQLEKTAHESLHACAATLKTFQTTKHLNLMTKEDACTTVSALVQSALWLLDMHRDLETISHFAPHKRIKELSMFLSTVQGQCRQTRSIFSNINVTDEVRKRMGRKVFK